MDDLADDSGFDSVRLPITAMRTCGHAWTGAWPVIFAGRSGHNGHSYVYDTTHGDLDTIVWGCIGLSLFGRLV